MADESYTGEAYCVKCKEKREFTGVVVEKNNRRMAQGICPVCGTADQYGDSCENCGSTYTPADLKDPISVVSGTALVTTAFAVNAQVP